MRYACRHGTLFMSEASHLDQWGDIIGSARDGTLAVGVTDTPTEGIVFSDGTDVTELGIA